MTNITGRKIHITHHEVSAPVQEGGVTRRDVADLMFFADQKYEEVHGVKPTHDDAWRAEPRDDELVAVIAERQTER